MKLLKSVITLLFVFQLIYVFAQPGNPGGGGPPEIPIDGGIGFLIAAGMVFGAKKIYDISKPGKKE